MPVSVKLILAGSGWGFSGIAFNAKPHPKKLLPGRAAAWLLLHLTICRILSRHLETIFSLKNRGSSYLLADRSSNLRDYIQYRKQPFLH